MLTGHQALIVSEVLDMCVENGFGHLYSLAPIAAKHGITDVLYDNNTNTGILWELGRHGSGLLSISNDGETATIPWDTVHIVQRALAQHSAYERKLELKNFKL